MNELIDKIENTVSELLQYDMKNYAVHAQELVSIMLNAFPVIISCYNDPAMSEVKEDALYWPGQLERIITSLENGDYFNVVDVLYNETRPNLIELRSILTKKGLL